MEGYPEIRMFYRYGGSFMGTMTETNKWVLAYQSPKLETVVNQSIWMDPETKMADIILPACGSFERNDIAEFANTGGYSNHASSGCNYRMIVYQKKCIEPIGESKSDLEIFTLLAERLGFKDDYTDGGKTEEDWIGDSLIYLICPSILPTKHLSKKDISLFLCQETTNRRLPFAGFTKGEGVTRRTP